MYLRRKRIAIATCMASLMVCVAMSVALSNIMSAGADTVTQPNGCVTQIAGTGRSSRGVA